jgi:hypothetical protein
MPLVDRCCKSKQIGPHDSQLLAQTKSYEVTRSVGYCEHTRKQLRGARKSRPAYAQHPEDVSTEFSQKKILSIY